ncbi:MAG: hypothetical protein HYY40_10300 [Bacteroidetes bacterium]|nr:hypothetical protein [Bacteroidota bacterium]
MAKENDEINLAESFSFINRFFSSLYRGCSAFSSFLLKNIYLLSIFFILGAGGGFFHLKFSKPVYHADLILRSNYADNDFVAEILDNIQQYIDDKSYGLLAQKFNMDSVDVRKVKKIYFSNFNVKLAERVEDGDTIVQGLPFRLNVCVTDYTLFDTLKTAIVSYLEKNSMISEEIKLRKRNTQLIINKIDKQLKDLDTLKVVIADHLIPRGNQNGFVFGQPLDPLNAYREAISLYKEELDISTDYIRTEKGFRVIRDFEVREKPYRPILRISLPVGGIVGFFAGLIVAFFLSTRRKGAGS